MKVTTTTAKMMASSQSSQKLCFSPGAYSFFQKSHFTFLVIIRSKMMPSPKRNQ